MQLLSELKRLTGVVEVGLFVGQVQEVYLGQEVRAAQPSTLD